MVPEPQSQGMKVATGIRAMSAAIAPALAKDAEEMEIVLTIDINAVTTAVALTVSEGEMTDDMAIAEMNVTTIAAAAEVFQIRIARFDADSVSIGQRLHAHNRQRSTLLALCATQSS